MASTITATILLERDGVPLPGFPVVRRLSSDEFESFNYDKANDGDTTTFTDLSSGQLATIKAFFITSNAAITVRLDGQTDAGITLGANGILLIVDATIDASATTNVKYNNNSGGVASLTGIAVGT